LYACFVLLYALTVIVGFQTTSICFAQDASEDPALEEVQKQMDKFAGVDDSDTASAQYEDSSTGTVGILGIIVRLLFSLVFVIFLLVGGVYVFKRFLWTKSPSSSRHINVISRISLSAKSSLHLVRVGNRYYLLGEGSESVNLIAEIPRGSSSGGDRDQDKASFEKELRKELKDVQGDNLSNKVQDAVKNCKEYLGRLGKDGEEKE